MSLATQKKVMDHSIKQLKLIEALGSSNWEQIKETILLTEKSNFEQLQRNYSQDSTLDDAYSEYKPYGSPLHLAITLSSEDLVKKIIQEFCVNESGAEKVFVHWLNAQNSPDKETPLHLCARLDRVSIIKFLLETNLVDDAMRNAKGQLADDLVKSTKAVNRLKIDRESYSHTLKEKLKSIISHKEDATQRIIELFNDKNPPSGSNRARSFLEVGWFDINAPIYSETEMSILHYAAKWGDLILVEWALNHGADVNVKDKKGKKPLDLASKKDFRVRDRLKKAVSQTAVLSSSLANLTLSPDMSSAAGSSSLQPPTFQGNLLKWTNFAGGYKPRYFVLEHGILSYYKSGEYPWSCRGSISMKTANVVFPDSEDKSRFDIVTSKNSVKFALKARTPTDAKKWTWALMESRRWMEDTAMGKKVANSNPQANSASQNNSRPETPTDFIDAHPVLSLMAPDAAKAGYTSSSQLRKGSKWDAVRSAYIPSTKQNNFLEKEDMSNLKQKLRIELDAQKEICKNFANFINVNNDGQSTHQNDDLHDLPRLLESSIQRIQELTERICILASQKEVEYLRKYQHETEVRKRWQELVKKVVGDVEQAESYQGSPEQNDLSPVSPVAKGESSPESSVNNSESDSEEVFYDAAEDDNGFANEHFIEQMFGFDALDNDQQPGSASNKSIADRISERQQKENFYKCENKLTEVTELVKLTQQYPFTDKRRSTLPLDPTAPKPSLNVWSFLKSAIGKDLSKVTLPVFFNEPLSMLQRMCEDIEYIELLTIASAVSLPLTQFPEKKQKLISSEFKKRAIENVHIFEQLSQEVRDSIRLLFVSAYAMSNYSSTVGRTNKPFNPMLGETFEMVDIDKEYRYVSEQVCHHPPISACYCESPDYLFWAEVNVKSKFWGKSLEIHPLGSCHVKLPTSQKNEKGETIYEHFSWKKVTTCVNNLIMGKLWIDHYGDMVIKNWKTKDECVLTFKQKNQNSGGWFGWGGNSGSSSNKKIKNAQAKIDTTADLQSAGGEIEGVLKTVDGRELWEIHGRWDNELVAKRLFKLPEELEKQFPQQLTLWKMNSLSPQSHLYFNYTNFAMSLNESNSALESCLPPTDSRLRLDQREMEQGHWEEANKFKEVLEKSQRKRRTEIVDKFNETGVPHGPVRENPGIHIGEEWWTPRWFVRDVDTDTSEEHWVFTGDYWKMRDELMNQKRTSWPEYVFDLFKD